MLNEIYERAMRCENCVDDQQKYLEFVFYEHKEEERKLFDTHVAVSAFVSTGRLYFRRGRYI